MHESLSDTINITNLPTIPHALLELIHLFEQPCVDFNALTEAVRQDPVVTAQVFELANSVYFRQWNKTSELKQLIVVLGVESVVQIAMLCATKQIFAQADNERELPIATLWYRSVLCANIAEKMATTVGYTAKHEAYLAGLLHRLGQWILIINDPECYLNNIDASLDLKQTQVLEKRLFNTCSSRIGAKAISHWQVCPFIADAVEFQTQPPDTLGDSTELVRILALSRILSEQSSPESAESIYAASRIFDLNNDMVQHIVVNARQQTDFLISRFFTIDTTQTSASGPELLNEGKALCQRELRLHVKNHALAGTMRMHTSDPEDIRITLMQLRRDFNLLFGLEGLCFLLTGIKQDALCGYDDLGTCPEMNQVAISFDNEISPAMKAFHKNCVSCSTEDSRHVFSVPERQLENLLGSKSICFIPMTSCVLKKGLVVAPVSACQWKQLSANRTLLRLCGQLSGEALKKVDQYRLRKEHDHEELQLNIRAAVHEINNPLSIINNYLYLLSQQLEAETAREQVAIIIEEIGRVSALVAGLKNLSGATDRNRGLVHINDLIEKLQELLAGSLFEARQLRLHVKLDNNLEPIVSIGAHLKQILINLLKNAAEALPAHGEVWLTTRGKVYSKQKQYVEIEIMDNGPGMEEHILENLFAPVKSTKNDHSGLGLAIVKQLLDDIDGEISCTSSTAGVRFQILLPRIFE